MNGIVNGSPSNPGVQRREVNEGSSRQPGPPSNPGGHRREVNEGVRVGVIWTHGYRSLKMPAFDKYCEGHCVNLHSPTKVKLFKHIEMKYLYFLSYLKQQHK